jgi:hypothetical protein
MSRFAAVCLTFLVSLLATSVAQAERIKDLAAIAGIRDNQLVGYGLVVGLDGTGDQTAQTPFTIQTVRNMLLQMGVTTPETGNPQLKNVAAVMVHATLPPFSKPGAAIDVTVSSMGNAKSLRGGSLIMTPLKGADGSVSLFWLPAKFSKNVWAQRGDYLIVEPDSSAGEAGRDSKVTGTIVQILFPEQVAHLRTLPCWPEG